MIYKRVESPTQTTTDAVRQVATGEIWGGVPRGGMEPTVQAYIGQLANRRGVEFTTPIAPEPNGSSPLEARWYYSRTAGVMHRVNANGDDMACISACVTNKQP